MVLFLSAIYFMATLLILFRVKGESCKSIFLISSVITYLISFAGLFIALPFTGEDTIRFERLAWEISESGFLSILASFDVSKSYMISSITAIFYYFMGREQFIPIIINALLGLFIMLNSLRLFDEIWGNDTHNRKLFFFLVAFSPMLTINSAIILRENYIILFLLIATIHLSRFSKNGNICSAMLFISFTLVSSFFHSATVLYILGLPIFLLITRDSMSYKLKVVWMILFILFLILIFNFLEFGKLKEIQEAGITSDTLAGNLSGEQQANTAYLQWLVPGGFFDIIWQAPIRAFFFLMKPFIWDVRSFGHAVSLLDALVWTFIVITLYRNRVVICHNPSAVITLISCAVLIVAFAYGTSNYGTAIRHRTKFLIQVLVLVSPFFISVRVKR